MHFTLDDIVKSTRGYTMKIGEGAFGTVYKGINFMGTGTTVAVKKLSKVALQHYYVIPTDVVLQVMLMVL